MGNQPPTLVDATPAFKKSFWSYTWYPVDTLRIYRRVAVDDPDVFEVYDGAGVYGSKYKTIRNMTVYSTQNQSVPHPTRKLVMQYTIPGFRQFVDDLSVKVAKMSEDGMYAQVHITTHIQGKTHIVKKTYTTVMYRRLVDLVF